MTLLKCPRCGTIVETVAGSSPVCPTCGFPAPDTRAAIRPPPPGPAPSYAPPSPYTPPVRAGIPAATDSGDTRAVGIHREPWLVVVLGIFTLNIYALIWAWKVSKEVDRFTGRPGWSHRKVRTGVLFQVAGLGAIFFGVLFFLVVAFQLAASDNATQAPDNPDGPPPAGVIVTFLLLFVLFLAVEALVIVGTVFHFMGLWRVWRAIEDDEKLRGMQRTLSPVLMLVLVLIPYVNIVGIPVMLYRSQKGLNGMWAGTRPYPMGGPFQPA